MAAASNSTGATDSSNTSINIMCKDGNPESARKRRKEILASTRHSSEKRQKTGSSVASSSNSSGPTSTSSACAVSTGKQRQIKGKTKYQNRYDPEVPMTKQEAAEWRREARRKRNRESAAASRNKVRNRISELENEVEEWKSKYSHLLERINRLESSSQSNSLVTDPVNAMAPSTVSPAISPTPTPLSLALNLDSLPIDLSIPVFEASSYPQHLSEHSHQDDQATGFIHTNTAHADADQEFHVIEMTSRPA